MAQMWHYGVFHVVAEIIRELENHMIPYKFKCVTFKLPYDFSYQMKTPSSILSNHNPANVTSDFILNYLKKVKGVLPLRKIYLLYEWVGSVRYACCRFHQSTTPMPG